MEWGLERKGISEGEGGGLQLGHVESMELGVLLVQFHLLEGLELAVARRADVERGLDLHLTLPLLGQHLCLPPLRLLLIHFLGDWLVFLELLLPFLLQLLHSY